MRGYSGTETFFLQDYIVYLVDNPLGMGSSLKESLIKKCIFIARKGFNNEKVSENDVLIHALDVDTGVYISDRKDLIAFGGGVVDEVEGEKILHLKGTAIIPEHQGKKLYQIITSLRALKESEKFRDFYVGSRTQNPRVFEFMTKNFDMWPKMGVEIPKEIKEVAGKYANYVQNKHSDFIPTNGIVFDKNNLIVRRAYGFVGENGDESGFCMYGDSLPSTKDQSINEYFKSNLNHNDGDAFILFGNFNKKKYLRNLENLISLDKDKKLYKRFKNSI